MVRLLWLSAVATAIIAASQASEGYYQCNNYMCNRVDKILKNSLNEEIDPCDDFRMHTCGSTNINITSSSILDGLRGLDTVQNKDTTIFRNILEPYLTSSNPNENIIDSLKIERQIYKSCILHGLRRDRDKEQYFKDLPENAKKLELGGVFEEAAEHWITSDMVYANKGYGFAFFDFKIVERISEHDGQKKRYIKISPPTDNIFDISSLFAKKYDSQDKPGHSKQTLLAHKKLKNFLEEFNRITLQKRDEEEVTNIVDQPQLLWQWQNKWNDRVRGHETAMMDWRNLFSKYFETAGVEAPYSDIYIIVNEENYFFSLIKLLSSTSMQTIENYVNLRYISKTIGLVDEQYFEYSMIPSISKLVCTPGLFVGTADAYAKKYFSEVNRNKLKEIFEAVRANIKLHVMRIIDYNLEAASKSTKSFLRKLENADVMYGYPSWLLDENLVANFYSDSVIINERYFNNEEAVYQSVLKHNLRAYHDPSLPIIDINKLFKAFTSDEIEIFEKNTNEIVIPVRVFSEANFNFFSIYLYDSMNYGSVATTLASKIYIKLLDTVEEFSITDCINNQLPRDLTEAEATDYKRKAAAYLMGLRTAYEVWWKRNHYEESLIQFNESGAISNSELFFFSFAETMCKNKNDPSNDMNIEIQPSQYINMVVSNMKKFQEAFLCEDAYGKKRHCDPLKYNFTSENKTVL